jgi:2-ketocyclohexanecarboxyl-CoA hydrolase
MKDSHVGGEPAFNGVVTDDLPDSGDLLVDVSSGVARITLNRPENLNALSSAHFRQLCRAFERVGWRDDVRVIVLTGAGRAFSAGGDLTTLSRAAVIESANASLHTVLTIRRCPKPVIAMVNGDAIGGGNEVVIACDLAIAAEEARLGQAGTRLGWAPVIGGTNYLSMSIGDKRAREVVFLSKIVPAAVALSWGWVNAVVPRRDLETVTQNWCDELILRSPDGLRLAKAASNIWWDLSLASMSPGIALIESGLRDEVVAEGISAFFEKRNPVWP